MSDRGRPPGPEHGTAASTIERGRVAEDAAAAHLVAHGLEIVDRNYSAAGAELDLVARAPASEGSTCVFVEVRSRASSELGSPLETVDRRKQRRVIRAATAWLVEHELWERVEVRFDVVAVERPAEPSGAPAITWIRDAFETA